jgi:hypothetical protein
LRAQSRSDVPASGRLACVHSTCSNADSGGNAFSYGGDRPSRI